MNIPAVPVIETERLRLRGHRLEDFPASASMWAEPVVVRFISGKPSNEQQSWSRFLNHFGHWVLMGFGYWLVEEKASGRFVGEIGFIDFKRDMTPSIKGIPELGWVLAPWAHGKGFATEAVRAAIAWGRDSLASETTVCIISPGNTSSMRVAEKCGFREVQQATYNGEPVTLYSRRFAE
jgi:RimJ/RimL family protein N-acetyltransferase